MVFHSSLVADREAIDINIWR